MKNDSLYHIFDTLSRVIIVFSVIVFIIGLIMRFNQSVTKKQTVKPTIVLPTKIQEKISTQVAELNLKGPFVCEFSSKEATASGYIKDNKVYGRIQKQMTINHILLNDDCFYTWESISSAGEKICGLKPYLFMIGNLPLSSLLGNIGTLHMKSDMVLSILNSCKKGEVKNEKVFDVPKGVKFIQSTRPIFPRN